VTPYIRASGYHSIFLQTFRPDGEDLERVNFQTPTEGVYRALAALLGVPLGPDGRARECAIVSTFNTRNVRDLSFRAFAAYGPTASPARPRSQRHRFRRRSTSTRRSCPTRRSGAPRSTAG
jgi:hypothetical protein